MSQRWSVFLPATVALWLLAHTVGFFSHEFAHTFVALALGWKNNPFDLDWGSPSLMNLLLQVDIDENVDYVPVFASGHGAQAGLIALAGMALGNAVVSLGIGFSLFALARRRGHMVLGHFAYWLVVMSVGNLLSYVPLRVFASHADMHTVALGFGWTPLQVLVVLGVPTLAVAAWFLLAFQPRALLWLLPGDTARRSVMAVLTSLTLFGWFALGGMFGYGEPSHQLSLVFLLVLGPLSLFLGLLLTLRVPQRA